jgi:hypothetical protein
LLKCCITALRITVATAIVIETPGAVLRLSGLFKVNDGRENAEDEQRKPHASYSPPLKNANTPYFVSSTPEANIAKLPELLQPDFTRTSGAK